MAKEYYLLPGKKIHNKDLPGGKVEAKKEPLKIEEKVSKVIGKSLDFLVTQGICSVGYPVPKGKASKGNASQKKKDEEILKTLIEEAAALEIEIPEGAKPEEIQALIDTKIAELEKE